jgi:YggT family protein
MGFVLLFINLLLNILTFAIIGRALLSWVDQRGEWTITRILHEITEPILGPIRSAMPSVGMFDFSPIIAILLLQVIDMAITNALT